MDEGIAFDLEDDVAAKAVELLGPSVLVWKDSTFKKKDESDESDAPRFCADTIGRALASLISPEPAPATSGRLSAYASDRSEEQTSELQSLMRISYSVFCLKKKKKT